MMVSNALIEARYGRRWVALTCLFLVVTFASIEAMHAHLADDVASASSACAICSTLHASAAAVTFHPFYTSFAAESVAASLRQENKSIVRDLAFFIRPPPFV